VLISRLYLRNFRVYEDELNLELPAGLVGIYGANGAGKSTLLEAILFTLWGKARTTREHIRSAGVGGECVTEVEFEHEGHLYLVRRLLKGINAAVSVEAHCDGLLMSTGTREVEHYVESVLGMDDAAFRASVFTEQKQLAAFSEQSPGDRRKLVLQLLGITPLDGARDAARKDARQLTADHERLRGMLVDLATLETEVGDAEAKAEAAERTAEDEHRAAETSEARLAAASQAFVALDQQRQEHEALVAEGRSARRDLDGLQEQGQRQRAELAELDAVAGALTASEESAAGLEAAEQRLPLVAAAASAVAALERLVVPDETPEPDEDALVDARETAGAGREAVAGLDALIAAAAERLELARDAAERSASLSGEADCPMCGQALGDALEAVQSHRFREVAESERRLDGLEGRRATAADGAQAAEAGLAAALSEVETARRLRASWEQADRQRRDAESAAVAAWSAVERIAPDWRRADGSLPAGTDLGKTRSTIEAELAAKRAAAAEMARIRGRLERRPALEQSMAALADKAAAAEAQVQALREKVRALAFDRDALDAAAGAMEKATTSNRNATAASVEAALEAARHRERAKGATERLAEGRRQHAQLGQLETDARHVARVSDLLADFRNTVVGSVGPRLATQAAELFAELTDHEYDRLEVDPDTYQLQISDAGRLYGLERFSGSEVDLANLAMRVAISEHIHFQSGGSVGLLVLDEVFGPLDEDRKSRMLLALERLRGRFRQILVVTHDAEIKDQLPSAIEVVKLPGRRATARAPGD
jgi:DNA repair protein SbcC/Rad50